MRPDILAVRSRSRREAQLENGKKPMTLHARHKEREKEREWRREGDAGRKRREGGNA